MMLMLLQTSDGLRCVVVTSVVVLAALFRMLVCLTLIPLVGELVVEHVAIALFNVDLLVLLIMLTTMYEQAVSRKHLVMMMTILLEMDASLKIHLTCRPMQCMHAYMYAGM